MKKISFDISTTFIGEILSFGASFGLGIITARILGVEGKGEFNILLTGINLLVIFSSFRFQKSLGYFAAKNKKNHGEAVLSAILVGFFSITIIYFANVIFPSLISFIFRNLQVSISFLVIYSFSTYLWMLIINLLPSLFLFRERAIFITFSYIFKAIFFIIFSDVARVNLIRYFEFLGIIEIVSYLGLIIYILIRNSIKLDLNFHLFKSMLIYTIGLLPSLISEFIILRFDIFIVNYFKGVSEVGIYTVAVSLASTLLYLPTAIKTVIFPHTSISGGNLTMVSKSLKLIIIIIMPFLLLFIPLAYAMIQYIYGNAFAGAFVPFIFLLPGTILWGIYSVLLSDLEGRGRYKEIMILSICSGITTVGLDIILIPIFGARGAALASSFSYSIVTFVSIFLICKHYETRIDFLIYPRHEDISGIITSLREYFGIKH